MKRLPHIALAITFLVISTISVATATTVIALGFDDLVSISDTIVIGEVSEVEAYVEHGKVYTRTEIKIGETLKGRALPKLEIVHIGGRTAKLVTRVHGMPDFTKGETALLFLEQPDGVEHFVVTGLWQGKIPLLRNEDGELTLAPAVATPVTQPMPRSVTLRDAKAPKPDVGPLAPPTSLSDMRTRIARATTESK